MTFAGEYQITSPLNTSWIERKSTFDGFKKILRLRELSGIAGEDYQRNASRFPRGKEKKRDVRIRAVTQRQVKNLASARTSMGNRDGQSRGSRPRRSSIFQFRVRYLAGLCLPVCNGK
jgi:hypothetical protein